jgi:hypothetical protein
MTKRGKVECEVILHRFSRLKKVCVVSFDEHFRNGKNKAQK